MDNQPQSVTLEETVRKYLDRDVQQSLPDFDMEVEEADLKVSTRHIRADNVRVKAMDASIKVRAFSAATFLMGLLSLITTFIVWLVMALK